DDARAGYDRALALRPDDALALSNRGSALHELKRFDEALTSYDRALALRPDDAGVHFNEAMCRLLIGDFNRGWAKFQLRRKRNLAQPEWLGSDEIGGKDIPLHAEASLGDTMQVFRYVPLLPARAARRITELPAA